MEGKIERLKGELVEARSALSAKVAPDSEILELPEAADLLNQLKARRKRSTATLADVEVILEMI
ncbi:hypothetical protein [Kamptonema sp. UHCC 0994]|uniref:hypothetical protein n=1 Tax=Kamptonema sp. UHCC 0994 TaxID=3031329 RepID=UPI0023BA05AC|nr:hypothetical protein [Kamptonema sp. UHCC 0994]MDF0553188.1 hypothetical protein [Kamptonema sp. UHCC 0994]